MSRKLMAKYLGVDCELVAVTGPNRIPYLLTGKVDALVSHLRHHARARARCNSAFPYSSIDIVLIERPKPTKHQCRG